MIALGCDGAAGGWVVVRLEDGAFAGALRVASLRDLPAADVVGVDIPLGLLPSGRRACEVEARRRLGRRASTLFLAPPRGALEADDYAEANRRARALGFGGLSKQVWNLRAAIRDAEAAADDRFHEVHPDLAFAALAGAPLPSKKTWNGLAARRRILAGLGVHLPDELGDAGLAGADDVVDAAVVAWVAGRIPTGEATRLGDGAIDPVTRRRLGIWTP